MGIANSKRRQRIGYCEGYIQAVNDFGIWLNGIQTIGCLNRPVREVVAPYLKELGEIEQEINKELEDMAKEFTKIHNND